MEIENKNSFLNQESSIREDEEEEESKESLNMSSVIDAS